MRFSQVIYALLLITISAVEPEVEGECFLVGDTSKGANDNPEVLQCFSTIHRPTVECIDDHEECEKWAQKRECRSNPDYMLFHCRKSCGSCFGVNPGVTQAYYPDQPQEDFIQTLVNTQQYIAKLVDGKSGILRDLYTHCGNRNKKCAMWKLRGECTKNAEFMRRECAAACQTCRRP